MPTKELLLTGVIAVLAYSFTFGFLAAFLEHC